MNMSKYRLHEQIAVVYYLPAQIGTPLRILAETTPHDINAIEPQKLKRKTTNPKAIGLLTLKRS